MKWDFKLYDINGDGVINRCEMTMIIESMFEMLDGVTMKLLPLHNRKNYAREHAKAIFTELDANNDLQLTKDDLMYGCCKKMN